LTTRVAIYARHSTDKQTHSTRDQIARCRKFCEQNNYEITQEFFDEGISGSAIINRPGIHELIESSLCGYFERVIAEDLSRFSRDQGDMSHFFKKMRFLDIPLETVSEGEINELHIGLKGTMNALYLKDLADKTHRGMIAAVLNGSIPGGKTYGYDTFHEYDQNGNKITGLRKINKEQAAIVLEIFAQYDEGATLNNICTGLNARGIPAPKGGAWGCTTLVGQFARKTGLLRQTLYKGVVTFNRMAYRTNPEPPHNRLSLLRPESEWLRVPAPELAIMDEAYFDQIQARIEERSSLRKQRLLLNQVLAPDEKAAKEAKKERQRRAQQAKPRTRSRYLVSGKMTCTEHGESILNARVGVYSCKVKGCANRNLKIDRDLMPIVLADLIQFEGDGLTSYLDSMKAERETLIADIGALEHKLETTQAKVKNVLDFVACEKATENTQSWFKDYERKTRRYRYDITGAKKKLRAISELSAKDMKTVVSAFHRAIRPIVIANASQTFDQDAITTVSPWFERFLITAQWDETENTWKRHVETRYNWPNLLKALRP